MTADWTRIPQPIAEERDRRELAAILTAAGLDVRIVRIRKTARAAPQKFVEFRDTGASDPVTLTSDL